MHAGVRIHVFFVLIPQNLETSSADYIDSMCRYVDIPGVPQQTQVKPLKESLGISDSTLKVLLKFACCSMYFACSIRVVVCVLTAHMYTNTPDRAQHIRTKTQRELLTNDT